MNMKRVINRCAVFRDFPRCCFLKEIKYHSCITYVLRTLHFVKVLWSKRNHFSKELKILDVENRRRNPGLQHLSENIFFNFDKTIRILQFMRQQVIYRQKLSKSLPLIGKKCALFIFFYLFITELLHPVDKMRTFGGLLADFLKGSQK